MISVHICTESCFRHPLFDLRGTRKVEIRHTNLYGYVVLTSICSAQSRNQDNSRTVLDKVGILTLSGEVGIPTWHGSIPELSLRKVGIGTK